MPKPSQNPVIKLLKIFSIVGIFLIFAVFVGRMSLITVRFPEPAAGSALAPSTSRAVVNASLYESGGTYHVKFPNVRATAADNQNFFNFSLDVEASSKEIADTIISNKDTAYKAIREVAEVFSFEDSKTQEGKIHMKERMKQKLSLALGVEGVSDINFEDFCLNKTECTAGF